MSERVEAGFAVLVGAALVVLLAAPLVVAAPPGERTGAAGDAASETETATAARAAVDIPRNETPPAAVEQSGSVAVDGERFETVDAALAAASPGDRLVLEGRFDGPVAVAVDDVTVTAGDGGAVIDGNGDGDVLRITGENVTVADLWVRNSGYETDGEDAGVVVDGNRTVLTDLYVSAITFGIWVDGVDDVTIQDSHIQGREDVYPLIDRGNGIQLWETDNTTVRDTRITTVRDGIYYSWAESVVSTNNTIWDSRYGVHYMYSDHNRLTNNLAVDNDVGFALMISSDLTVANNTALGNAGQSGHGILLKSIDRSTISDNVLVENDNGLYVYNSNDDSIDGNLLVHNQRGVHHTAGSQRLAVANNSFIGNTAPVYTTTADLAVWNGTDRGNYWSSASTADVTGDEVSEVRHRPSGLVEHMTVEQPQAAVFAASPAFDTVRLAESSFPVVESPGIVDHHPLVEPPHDTWRQYANHR